MGNNVKRRTFLKVAAGAGGAVALAGAGYGLAQLSNNGWPFTSDISDGIVGEPKVLRSRNGLLEVELVAAPALVEIDGIKVKAITYNSSLPGPTMVVNPGDTIRVKFVNQIGEPTNLHMHGLHVSPEGNSDNVMIQIENGQVFEYEYKIGEDHPISTNWYHPHLHGSAANQLFAGLYGTVIVEPLQMSDSLASRVLVISDIDFDADGNLWQPNMMALMMGREGSRILMNGQKNPELTVAANSSERWHLVNACSSRYLHLHFPGIKLSIENFDSGYSVATANVDEIILAPGNRVQAIAEVGSSPASIKFDSLPHPDMMADPVVGQVLARVTPISELPAKAAPLALGLNQVRDLRTNNVALKRKFVLAMPAMASMGNMGNMNGMNHSMSGMNHGATGMQGMFTINGESFDMLKINTRVALGTIEEWTISNTSGMNHPFHLHVWPMQLISTNGVAEKQPQWRDVVNVPYQGEVVVRISFERIAGKTMYHCHILDHEDLGMMGQIEAV